MCLLKYVSLTARQYLCLLSYITHWEMYSLHSTVWIMLSVLKCVVLIAALSLDLCIDTYSIVRDVPNLFKSALVLRQTNLGVFVCYKRNIISFMFWPDGVVYYCCILLKWNILDQFWYFYLVTILSSTMTIFFLLVTMNIIVCRAMRSFRLHVLWRTARRGRDSYRRHWPCTNRLHSN